MMSEEVLIVDDDPAIRELFLLTLEDLPYEFIEFESGNSALEYCQKKKDEDKDDIKLIISDVRMPNGDGVYLLKEIRKLHGVPPAFLIMTGFCDYSPEKLIEMGATDYIEKPADPGVLLSIVEKILKPA